MEKVITEVITNQCFIIMKGIELMAALSGEHYLKKSSVHAQKRLKSKSGRNEVSHVYLTGTNRGKYSLCRLMMLVKQTEQVWRVVTPQLLGKCWNKNPPMLDKSIMFIKKDKTNCLSRSIALLFFSLIIFFLSPSAVHRDPTLFGDQTRHCCQSVSLNKKSTAGLPKTARLRLSGTLWARSGTLYAKVA